MSRIQNVCGWIVEETNKKELKLDGLKQTDLLAHDTHINIFGREHKCRKDKSGNYPTGQQTEW
jgi:hypothetical protein